MAKTRLAPNAPCPCGSGKKYRGCCRPYHQGQSPPMPEALMRSRYTAYALGNVDYIIQTTHPDSPHRQDDASQWRADLSHFTENTTFVKLEVLSTEAGEDADTGYVTFRAVLLQGVQDASFTERSLFKRHNERWRYVAGEVN